MTNAELIRLLRDRIMHPDAGEGSIVQLRHDRELVVFNRDGHQVGESIVLRPFEERWPRASRTAGGPKGHTW